MYKFVWKKHETKCNRKKKTEDNEKIVCKVLIDENEEFKEWGAD